MVRLIAWGYPQARQVLQTSAPRFTYDWGFVATSTASLSLSNWVFPASSLSGLVVVVAFAMSSGRPPCCVCFSLSVFVGTNMRRLFGLCKSV